MSKALGHTDHLSLIPDHARFVRCGIEAGPDLCVDYWLDVAPPASLRPDGRRPNAHARRPARGAGGACRDSVPVYVGGATAVPKVNGNPRSTGIASSRSAGEIASHARACRDLRPCRLRLGRSPNVSVRGRELSRTPRQLNPDPRGTPIDPEVLKRLISGREPAGLDRYIMQVRTNVAYSGGSGLIDLGQFRFGIGRQLVDEVEIPDHNTYITLDEYLVDTYRRQMGFSPTSREIANNLLAQHPRTELFIALIGLNRVRKLPDALAQLEAGYLTKLPPGAADVYRGLMSDTNQPRFFLARQLILLAIREALTYTGPTLVTPTLDPIATAVMLTHALGTDLQYTGGGISLWEGMTSGDLMGIVQNAAFHAADDVMSLLDRHWRVWIELGESAAKEMPRAPFQRMAREAIGLDLRTALMLGLALKTRTEAWRPPSPLVVDAEFVTDADPLDLEAFLQFTTTSAEALTNDLASTTGAWEFLPLERSPVLRVEDKLLVIDETYLLKRVTDGIFLAVADMEGPPSGSKPRRAWSKAYSEVR